MMIASNKYTAIYIQLYLKPQNIIQNQQGMHKYTERMVVEKKSRWQEGQKDKRWGQLGDRTDKKQQKNNEKEHSSYNLLNSFFKHNNLAPNHQQTKALRIKTGPESSEYQMNQTEQTNLTNIQLDQIKERYQTLEELLNNQNLNLKMQSQYLSNEIRKMYKREKYYKQQCMESNKKYAALQASFKEVLGENEAIRSFMEDSIMKMVHVANSPPQEQFAPSMKNVIKEICHFFDVKVDIQVEESKFQAETVSKFHKKVKQEEFQQRIEELNDKFQAMMYEYKNSNNSELRKECIKIARQIKQMKSQKQKSHSKQLQSARETIQTLSRNASKELKVLEKQLRPRSHKYSRSFGQEDHLGHHSTQKIKHPFSFHDSIISKTNIADSNTKISSSRKRQYKV